MVRFVSGTDRVCEQQLTAMGIETRTRLHRVSVHAHCEGGRGMSVTSTGARYTQSLTSDENSDRDSVGSVEDSGHRCRGEWDWGRRSEKVRGRAAGGFGLADSFLYPASLALSRTDHAPHVMSVSGRTVAGQDPGWRFDLSPLALMPPALRPRAAVTRSSPCHGSH